MKIRTDFVTNSSSYLSAEIIIDNPVLLEILQKYKDMGLFGNQPPIFGIGSFVSPARFFNSGVKEIFGINVPAFFYYQSQSDDDPFTIDYLSYPNRLDKVLQKIIGFLDTAKGEYLNTVVCDKLIDELRSKENEILIGYRKVRWLQDFIYTDCCSKADFRYDLDFGERCDVDESDPEDDDDDEE